ncbi:DJ-1/PfpI family protein [Marinilabiliaceae bacterium ANBcel2]|nr:DJ-1/PfpI family protein [Marinilabiliaceae bacterium ANBcel2]
MSDIYVFLADGFEEVEAMTPVDVLRRAGFDVKIVSVTGAPLMTGSHGIAVKCDIFIDDVDLDSAQMIILPGGLPGATNLLANERVKKIIREFNEKGKWLGAICAAPMVLGELGILDGLKATCYPGFEKHLKGAEVCDNNSVTSKNIVTGRGIGAAMDFSLEIVRNLMDEASAKELAKKMVAD